MTKKKKKQLVDTGGLHTTREVVDLLQVLTAVQPPRQKHKTKAVAKAVAKTVTKKKTKKLPPLPPPKPPAGVPASLSAKKGTEKKAKKQIKGFAYMKLTNPKRLHQISVKAGRRAQKKWGEEIRWNSQQAKKMASRGGLARWGRLLPRPEDAA